MMRLGFFLSTLTSIFVVVYCTVYREPMDAAGIVGLLQGTGYAGKVLQKRIEEDHPIDYNGE